ncbi:hypothetical protein JG688_00014873, partial [Phytophthora aleatoria]
CVETLNAKSSVAGAALLLWTGRTIAPTWDFTSVNLVSGSCVMLTHLSMQSCICRKLGSYRSNWLWFFRAGFPLSEPATRNALGRLDMVQRQESIVDSVAKSYHRQRFHRVVNITRSISSSDCKLSLLYL